jgi:hypothetical protein
MDEEHGTDHSTAGLSAERIGRNDAIFRHANEGISEVAEAQEIEERVPFICDCADPACLEIVQMSMEEYREIRKDPRVFVNVPGHEASAQGWAQAIESHDRYVVVVKVGPAAEVAEQLEGDPDPASATVEGDEPYLQDDKV